MTVEISVVVPTVDRVALLERTLRGLLAQEDVTFEVLVVSGGHRAVDGLLDRWESRLPLRRLVALQGGAAVESNVGWRAATAPLIAITEDDCEAAPGWLAALRDGFAEGVDAVQGAVAPHPEDGRFAGPFARTAMVDTPSTLYLGSNLAFRRRAVERVGGYDESLSGGAETDLVWRVREAGGAVAWAPDALVWRAARALRFREHIRRLPHWEALPLLVRRHPGLRPMVQSGVFWKRSHPAALLALAGLALSPWDRRAALLAAPLLVGRVHQWGARDGLVAAAADVAEVAALTKGSVRHRSVVL